jgi:hypothetical protein
MPIVWRGGRSGVEFLLQVELAQERISQGEDGDPTSAGADKN